jgi:hypothetical protein
MAAGSAPVQSARRADWVQLQTLWEWNDVCCCFETSKTLVYKYDSRLLYMQKLERIENASPLYKLREERQLVVMKFHNNMHIVNNKIATLQRLLGYKRKSYDKACQALEDITCEHNKQYGYCTECKNWGGAVHPRQQARRRRWDDDADSAISEQKFDM